MTEPQPSAAESTVSKDLQQDMKHVYIGLVGPTGAGKSSFINLVSKSTLKESNKLASCTETVQAGEPFELDGHIVTLIDTPGFDDSSKSQMDILKEITSHLEIQYKNGILLHGVLYFHRISDNRMGGIARQNFSTVMRLIGDKAIQNTVIVTTMWDRVSNQEGEERLHQLKTSELFFKSAVDEGAPVTVHQRTVDSAQAIIRHLLCKSPVPLEIQKELVDEGKDISETAAGIEVNRQVAALIQEQQKEIEEMEQEMREAITRHDEETKEELEREAKRLKDEIQETQHTQQNLREDYGQRKATMNEDYREFEEVRQQLMQAKLELAEMDQDKNRILHYPRYEEQGTNGDQSQSLEGDTIQEQMGLMVQEVIKAKDSHIALMEDVTKKEREKRRALEDKVRRLQAHHDELRHSFQCVIC